MLHQVLKSKLYKAVVTDSVVDYEGSIEIPRDLMEASGLWEGEKVLVASIDTAARLETGDPRYSWVNHIVFVCAGVRRASAVEIAYYKVI